MASIATSAPSARAMLRASALTSRRASSSSSSRARVVSGPRSSPTRRGATAASASAAGDAGAAPESFEGELIANNAASLNGKLRTLVVGVADERGDELLNHRQRTSGTLFKHARWIDAFELPGQYVTITDVDSGKAISKPISVSPYRARSTAPNSDVSVVELLLDTGSDDGDENFFAAAQPPMRLRVSAVKGCGFENPLFPEYCLKSAIERGHAIVCVAGGPRGMGPLRSVIEWPPVSSHAGKNPVTLLYLHAGDSQSAAYVSEWDSWREGGNEGRDVVRRFRRRVVRGEASDRGRRRRGGGTLTASSARIRKKPPCSWPVSPATKRARCCRSSARTRKFRRSRSSSCRTLR